MIEWKWVGNGVYEILREGSPYIAVRVAEIGPGQWRWRAFDGEAYRSGIEGTEAAAKAEALDVAGLLRESA